MKNGYTLIEIMIVMAIMAIVFTIGYNNYQNYLKSQSFQVVIRSMQSDLRSAQELASAGSKPSGCTVLNGYQYLANINGYQIRGFCSDPSVGNTYPIIKQITFPSGFTISSLPTTNPVTFKSLGQGTNIPTGNNAITTITQASTGTNRNVVIGQNGNVE